MGPVLGKHRGRLFLFLASFAQAGRTIRDGGQQMIQSGRDLGDSLAGVPLVGSQLGDIARNAFAAPGQPLSDFGSQLEQFIVIVSVVLALLLALVTLVPWLNRYLPWRWKRLRRVRAASRAIRTAPALLDASIERILAMRAVCRLDYSTLLGYTPDPLGDWATAATTGSPARSSPASGCGSEPSRFRQGMTART